MRFRVGTSTFQQKTRPRNSRLRDMQGRVWNF